MVSQVCTQSVDGMSHPLIYSRAPDECVVISLDPKNPEAQLKRKLTLPASQGDYWTHIASSLHVPGEVLLASMEGQVQMWSVDHKKKFSSFSVAEMAFKEAAPYEWTGRFLKASDLL